MLPELGGRLQQRPVPLALDECADREDNRLVLSKTVGLARPSAHVRVVGEAGCINTAGNKPDTRRRHLSSEERGLYPSRDGNHRVNALSVEEASRPPFSQRVVHPSGDDPFHLQTLQPGAQGMRSGSMKMDEIVPTGAYEST